MIAEPDAGAGKMKNGASPRPILFIEDVEADFTFARRGVNKLGIVNPTHWVRTVEELGDYMGRRGSFSDLQNGPLPAVVVLDMMLDHTSGIDAHAMLRGSLRWRRIPG